MGVVCREDDGEGAAGAHPGLELDVPAERLHHLPHQREPEPDARRVLLMHRLELLEWLEDVRVDVGGMPGPESRTESRCTSP